VVSTGVRLRWFNVVVALCVAACASPPPVRPSTSVSPTSPSAQPALRVTPSSIHRLRGAFPPGYEVTDAAGSASPVGYWGFGAEWAAEPPQCGALAKPVANSAVPEGLSGSGPGGIVYAIVAASPSGPLTLDPGLVAECGQWSMTAGRATATVDLIEAPTIDGIATLGMATATRTIVEGGTETDSQAHTFTAYLGDYLAFVAVITDPGSPHPPLPPEFAATLFVKAVATLRG
jgi:hypothetical protein